MKKKNLARIVAVLSSLFTLAHSAFAQGTAFTYQGQLVSGGLPANGNFDFTFALFSNNSTNTGQIGGTLTNLDVGVTNGLFTITLDFGSAFTGNAAWLSIGVRTNGDASFTALNPLQALTPTPYAIYAPNAGVAASVTGAISLAQLPTAVVTNGDSGVTISGTFSGNGAGVTNVPGTTPWQTVSGANVTAASNRGYLLTNNAQSTLTLPSSANVGDIVTVSGSGTNGWQVSPGPSQAIAGATNIQPAGTIWTDQNNAPVVVWTSVASSSDGTHLVAVNYGNPIYTSTNSGTNWTAQNNSPFASWQCVASSSDGTHLVAAIYEGPIYTSTNSGVTWTNQNNAPSTNWDSIASSSDGTYLVATIYEGPIYTSTNSGVTWTDQNNAPSTYWRSVASSADGTHLVAVADSYENPGPIYTSTNSGVTWTDQNNAPLTRWASVASSSDGTHLVALVGNVDYPGPVYTSTNSGVTWTVQNNAPSANWYSVASSSDGTHLVAVVNSDESSGPVYTSTNSGVTWTGQNNSPSTEWTSVASSADGTHLVATAYYGNIYTSDPTAFFNGVAGETAQFQYIGNGIWQPLGESASQISGGTLSTAVLPGVVVTNTETGVTLGGTFTGNGGGLTNLNPAKLVGGPITNAVSTPGSITITPASSAAFNGNGSGLTNLNPAKLVGGPITNAVSTPGNITITPASSAAFNGNGGGLTNLINASVTSIQNLSVLQGLVAANGSIISGSGGFTVTSNSVGSYTINFTTAFANIPAVVLSGASCIASWSFVNPITVNVQVVTYGGTPLSQDFMFIAIGPR